MLVQNIYTSNSLPKKYKCKVAHNANTYGQQSINREFYRIFRWLVSSLFEVEIELSF